MYDRLELRNVAHCNLIYNMSVYNVTIVKRCLDRMFDRLSNCMCHAFQRFPQIVH